VRADRDAEAGRVVALDRTTALLAGTASTMLQFKLDKPCRRRSRPMPASPADRPAQGARRREAESMLAVLHAGCELEDLEIGRADLEDVFIEIMQGETPARVAA
jgi:ABC-2 type transport system ATP-binding protein